MSILSLTLAPFGFFGAPQNLTRLLLYLLSTPKQNFMYITLKSFRDSVIDGLPLQQVLMGLSTQPEDYRLNDFRSCGTSRNRSNIPDTQA